MLYIKKLIYIFIVLVCLQFSYSQERTIRGFVKDSLQQPLENATLIASPLQKGINITYTTTNALGYYELVLSKLADYTIEVSYLGYKKLVEQITTIDNKRNYNFILQEDKESLDEVIINYKYKAIEKKKDTIIYNLKAFTSGNEYKMEDVLAKLPGIKIDGNIIKVHGKTVNKLLVDGKLFFGGSTKLAIENIPANVMDKIEIISDYIEDELLKDIVDEKDLALNVVLKEDKKNFIFGGIEAGLGLNDFYILHPTLFKYSPKSNISFIGDVNNYNSSSLSFSDLLRLKGGFASLMGKQNSENELFNFAVSGKEKFKSTTRFSALNFYHEFNEKLDIKGYAIYSNNDFINKNESTNQYINTGNNILETRNALKTSANNSANINFKVKYKPSEKEMWTYNLNYLTNNTNFNNTINSESDVVNQFLTDSDGTNQRFSQYLEGFKKIVKNHTTALSINHAYSNSNSIGNWISDSVFLEDYFPLTTASNFQINKSRNVRANNFNVILKDYWLFSNYTHLFTSLGYNYKNVKIRTNESQILPDNSSIDFSENNPDFGNDLNMTLSDLYSIFGVKSKIGATTITFQVSPHYYKLNLQQVEQNENSKLFIEPKLNILYNLDTDETLEFSYTYSNTYPNANKFLRNRTITGYNSVFQGNSTLSDEKFHSISLDYDNNKREDFYIFAGIDFDKRNPVVNSTVTQIGINRVNTPILLNLPETSLGFMGEVGRYFESSSSLDFSMSLDWSQTNQGINNDVTIIEAYDYGFNTEWRQKINSKTHLNLEYKINVNTIVNEGKSTFVENILSLKFDSRLFKNTTFKTDFSVYFINDYENVKSSYAIPNIYFDYRKPNSKFSYGLVLENILNNGVILNNSFTNTIIASQKTFTLPRVFLFKLKYKY
ncbi:MAG: carboxypeptidase-like regulatory domain-containing protein [Flavobacteriaceae bacterium]|nr:carboxypeptidase-like regulatory domain-containing protein [Flavobacteriaceae bacterium]